jgi:hypothetical protein
MWAIFGDRRRPVTAKTVAGSPNRNRMIGMSNRQSKPRKLSDEELTLHAIEMARFTPRREKDADRAFEKVKAIKFKRKPARKSSKVRR